MPNRADQDEISFDTLAAEFGLDDEALFTDRPPIRDDRFQLEEVRSNPPQQPWGTHGHAYSSSSLADRFIADDAFETVSSPSPVPQRKSITQSQQEFQSHAVLGPIQDQRTHRPGNSRLNAVPSGALSSGTLLARGADVGRTSGGVRLRPVSALPAQFRGMYKFGLFNAIQSETFDTVSSVGEAPVHGCKQKPDCMLRYRLSTQMTTSSSVLLRAQARR